MFCAMNMRFQMPRDARGCIAANLFFALLPDHSTAFLAETLALGLSRVHGLKGRPIDADRLHLTLCGVPLESGALLETVEKARDAAAGIAAGPLEVCLDTARSFAHRDGRHPFVLSCGDQPDGLLCLRQRLGIALKHEGLDGGPQGGFTPHMTLLWADRMVEDSPIVPVRWTARDFALVLSLVGQSRHITLGRWPLRGAPIDSVAGRA
jgi:RNA 2',3'-cyclic 3'-phosphodiesterase